MIRVYPVQDDDGDWYIIPYKEADKFHLMENGIIESEPDSEEEEHMIAQFEHHFGKYRTGGDLNLIALYAEKNAIG